VIKAFRAYAIVLALVWTAASIAVAIRAPGVVIVPAAALAILHGVAAFVPFRPWGWTLAFVTLGFGIASFAFVLALPLAIAWNRPIVRAAFGRPP
jgi:hypothetical protein